MPRRLGKTDYSVQSPLAAVIDLMDRCEDAIVLGYPYHETSYSMTKCGNMVDERMAYVPTPWNQIEGTLAYRKGIPVLVVAQKAVEGGLFDIAVTGETGSRRQQE